MRANLELLALLVEHLLLTGLPAVATALLASRWGLRSTPLLLGVAPRRLRDDGDRQLLALLREPHGRSMPSSSGRS